LDPVSGSKDLWPYVVYEQDTVCVSDIMQWIQHMSKAFDVSGLKVIVVEQALRARDLLQMHHLGVHDSVATLFPVSDGTWQAVIGK
jgi:hypothetical protein